MLAFSVCYNIYCSAVVGLWQPNNPGFSVAINDSHCYSFILNLNLHLQDVHNCTKVTIVFLGLFNYKRIKVIHKGKLCPKLKMTNIFNFKYHFKHYCSITEIQVHVLTEKIILYYTHSTIG